MSIPGGHTLRQNQVLSAFSEAEYEYLSPHATLLSLDAGQVICQPGEFMDAAYFPISAMISLVSIMEDGSSTEISLVGNEGMVGLPIILGSGVSTHQVVTQIAGNALRCSANVLKDLFNRSESLRRLLLRYTQVRLIQVSQNAACNRKHTIEARLARSLLLVRDCLCSNEIPLTQEFIANMLGTQRPGVNIAAQLLQQKGLICSSRGKITILDGEALESVSCVCYQVVLAEYSRLLRPR